MICPNDGMMMAQDNKGKCWCEMCGYMQGGEDGKL